MTLTGEERAAAEERGRADAEQGTTAVRPRVTVDAELFGQIMSVLYGLPFGQVEAVVLAVREDARDA